ncbi:helix-turn-helix transcriptional regulator [Lactococcus raffinolactis]|uniref:helix-turn-helix domain-containing protein n=1 Tax=Pseudolactococcus raffinolactis TaxID=1366 RepID=UPI00288FA3C8|nr:helix-turn-helix transcriptional regulator [Lactococcus raffinolactis]MDT2767071.1 helix-turn-helix transcriptional regulator [Lactococcus raffinolactis]MDT2790196.1 helix-turn-helix transcriptional regulator [Lactococcus raffinolactis]
MLAERLKATRLEEKITQKEISDKLKISQPSYAQWEKGIRVPNIERLQELAKILNTSTDYLLGNTDIKNQKQFDEDLEKSLDTFKSFDGKPMYDEDREKIREFLRKRMEDRLKDN